MEGLTTMSRAKILDQDGKKKGEIAEILGVSRRTVYNYLNNKVFQEGKKAGRPKGSVKLKEYSGYIDSVLSDDDFEINGEVLYEKLEKQGYKGKRTILNDYIRSKKEEFANHAILRYETIPGEQAQVDWGEIRGKKSTGEPVTLYCFVMKLGYSRKSYIEFTSSMKQPILFACMKRAFDYFGGVPGEILFDNMKTAFVYDTTLSSWKVNDRLAHFAAHYQFVPRRCRVRRPQTKGKVEREIRYLKHSFLPGLYLDGIKYFEIELQSLNEKVLNWLTRVDKKVLRELGENRNERFVKDQKALREVPYMNFDCRVDEPLKVSLEGLITFKSNRYSVPAKYCNKTLCGKHDLDTQEMELFYEGFSIKTIKLFADGSHEKKVTEEDRESLYKAWKKGAYSSNDKIESIKKKALEEVIPQDPTVYDVICTEMECVV
jgi:transposase